MAGIDHFSLSPNMSDDFPSIVDAETQQGIQGYRVEQVRRRLVEADCPAIVLFDPVHIRYATGTRNMQVWTMHNICRYTVVFASGETVLFELGRSAHRAHTACIIPSWNVLRSADETLARPRFQISSASESGARSYKRER